MSKNGSGEPPSWEELVSQVQGAMEELNLNSPENQALFVEGLKEVMESLESMGFPVGMGMPPMPPSAGAKKPDIQVFEGGKKESEDPKDSTEAPEADAETAPKSEEESAPKADAKRKNKAPHLKVAPPEEPSDAPADTNIPPFSSPFSGFYPADPEELKNMFRFLRVGDHEVRHPPEDLSRRGKIHIEESGSGFQNIFRGKAPRLYRIECLEGGLQIYLDGEPVEEIRPGQSTDVEAEVIRVKASEGSGAEGAYSWVDSKS